MENRDKKEIMEQKQAVESEYILTLREPIQFEGDTVDKIDLSPLKEATGADLSNARRMMNMNGFSGDFFPEQTFEFAACLMASVSKKPMDLFYSLRLKDAMEFKNTVRRFLY